MLQIRQGVFETNSSSTHSITMCSKDEYKKWMSGELYLNDDGWWGLDCMIDAKDKTFITKDEAISLLGGYKYCDYSEETLRNLDDEELHEEFYENGIYSCEDYWERRCEWFETFENDFTTESGDEVVAFGFYGHD